MGLAGVFEVLGLLLWGMLLGELLGLDGLTGDMGLLTGLTGLPDLPGLGLTDMLGLVEGLAVGPAAGLEGLTEGPFAGLESETGLPEGVGAEGEMGLPAGVGAVGAIGLSAGVGAAGELPVGDAAAAQHTHVRAPSEQRSGHSTRSGGSVR